MGKGDLVPFDTVRCILKRYVCKKVCVFAFGMGGSKLIINFEFINIECTSHLQPWPPPPPLEPGIAGGIGGLSTVLLLKRCPGSTVDMPGL